MSLRLKNKSSIFILIFIYNIYQKLKRNYGGTGEGISVKYRSGEGRS
jgi:hypothetical protein